MPNRALIAMLLAALAVGCNRSGGGPAAAPVLVAVVEPPAPAGPESAPAPRPAAEPFRPPTDAAGKTVAAALAPAVPPAPPPPGATRKPRTSAFDRGEPPLPPATAIIPTLPPPAAKPPRLSPPPERVPADLGQLAVEAPAKVRLPERPLVRAQAANPSADLPPLASQLPDRAPLDDPTAEIAAARAVFTALPLPAPAAWFARFGIPDPFEFVAQMKGKTAVGKELGTAPVIVPPARP